MRYLFLYASILPICVSTEKNSDKHTQIQQVPINNSFAKVADIPLPKGYHRDSPANQSFAFWLGNVNLKNDKTVYLFNGTRKGNQNAQFAVLNISVGNKNLQQCADAVMRLRAEYLMAAGRQDEIVFYDNASRAYRYKDHITTGFTKYMEKVYSWCGTLSLEKQLKQVRQIKEIEPGFVFVKGGSPGHAVIVMDVARSATGKKVFLLAQSYMPAQDIHILKNPMDPTLSPWYEAVEENDIITPEWTFTARQLKKWN